MKFTTGLRADVKMLTKTADGDGIISSLSICGKRNDVEAELESLKRNHKILKISICEIPVSFEVEDDTISKRVSSTVTPGKRIKLNGIFKMRDVTYSKCAAYFYDELKEEIESLKRNNNELIRITIDLGDGFEREVYSFDELIRVVEVDVVEYALSA